MAMGGGIRRNSGTELKLYLGCTGSTNAHADVKCEQYLNGLYDGNVCKCSHWLITVPCCLGLVSESHWIWISLGQCELTINQTNEINFDLYSRKWWPRRTGMSLWQTWCNLTRNFVIDIVVVFVIVYNRKRNIIWYLMLKKLIVFSLWSH